MGCVPEALYSQPNVAIAYNYALNPYSAGIDFSRQVYRQQILTTKV